MRYEESMMWGRLMRSVAQGSHRIACLIAILLGAVGCSSSSTELEVDRARCTRLRDHLVELRLSDAGADVDVVAHRLAMKQALGDGFISTCERNLSASELTCALKAQELRAATSCGASVSASHR
jgi:hypothetical protein